MIRNSKKHPEAWDFYIKYARNIKDESDLVHLGNYRISVPDMSGNFIYADRVEDLWKRFISSWYEVRIDSPSVYGKIQYIVEKFK